MSKFTGLDSRLAVVRIAGAAVAVVMGAQVALAQEPAAAQPQPKAGPAKVPLKVKCPELKVRLEVLAKVTALKREATLLREGYEARNLVNQSHIDSLAKPAPGSEAMQALEGELAALKTKVTEWQAKVDASSILDKEERARKSAEIQKQLDELKAMDKSPEVSEKARLLELQVYELGMSGNLEGWLVRQKGFLAKEKEAVSDKEVELALAGISAMPSRTVKRKQLEASLTKTRAEQQKTLNGKTEQIVALHKSLGKTLDQWKRTMSKYIRSQSKPFGNITFVDYELRPDMGGLSRGILYFRWCSSRGPVAYGVLNLPVNNAYRHPESVAYKDVYLLNESDKARVEVYRMGHLELTVYGDSDNWKGGSQEMLEFIKTMVDVDGLARLEP